MATTTAATFLMTSSWLEGLANERQHPPQIQHGEPRRDRHGAGQLAAERSVSAVGQRQQPPALTGFEHRDVDHCHGEERELAPPHRAVDVLTWRADEEQ